MRLRRAGAAMTVMVLLLMTRLVNAQSTTGTIFGHVTDGQGLVLPGVTVSVSSPNLQGVRTAITSEIGDYAISLLPSGNYSVTFDLAGFQKQEMKAVLAPTQTMPLDVVLGHAVLAEEVTVVGA